MQGDRPAGKPNGFSEEEATKVFAAAERILQLELRGAKLRRLHRLDGGSDRKEHIAALIGELSNALKLERNLLVALPGYDALQPSTESLPATVVNSLVFAFHRSHGRWYPGRLLTVLEEGAAGEVGYIGYEEKERLPATMIKAIEGLAADCFHRDAPCAYIDSASGRIHAAWVVDPDGPRPLLKRKSDGLTRAVEREFVLVPRYAPEPSTANTNVILPNDPREVRIRKKKAAKRLKYQARSEEVNDFFRQRQQSWFAFTHRDEKRENLFKSQRRG